MKLNPEENEKREINNKPALFQLTKHQLASDIEKYDKAAAAIQVFQTLPVDEAKLRERPVIFQKRLNALDSSMLEESAYIALDDPELKLEKRIENYEKTINSLDEQISVAETVKDEASMTQLMKQKKQLSQKVENLQIEYKNQNLDTKLTTVISKMLQTPSKLKQQAQVNLKLFFRRSKFLRQFNPFMKSIAARETIEKLDKINKSVDQLVKMQVPFGEQDARYQTLVNHLSKASALHSQIQKELLG